MIPQSILHNWLASDKSVTIFGSKLTELSRDELEAIAHEGWKRYNDQSKRQIERDPDWYTEMADLLRKNN